MQHNQLTFLVVDDNELDIERVERSLKRSNINSPVVKANGGHEALDLLRGSNGKEKVSEPYLILLDLNMPKMNGLEFLDELRQDPLLSDAPVFVLTTSDRRRDIDEANQRNISGYFVKPITQSDIVTALTLTSTYWSLLPQPSAPPEPQATPADST